MKPIDTQAASIQWGIEIETRIPDSCGIAVGPYPNGAYEVSVAHYSEQNGDAMRDAKITFLVQPTDHGHAWSPLTFENSYLGAYQVVAVANAEGVLQVRQPRQMQELREFANQWDINLKHQGVGEAAARSS
jgi:hypothetical protein